MNKKMKGWTRSVLVTIATLLMPMWVAAQQIKEVHGEYVYSVGLNEDITLRDATRRCVELAKAEAIKAAFGELVTSDVIDSSTETNGESSSSFYWENTVAMARGEWLSDTNPHTMQVTFVDDRLLFRAEVWGKAREIMQPEVDLRWQILKDANGRITESREFMSGERIYVEFQSPADGYVAIYLITGDDETACLLPYKNNGTGKYSIKQGKKYRFFDKEEDMDATQYRLSTKQMSEDNQLVIIYSPHPFAKCSDISKDKRHPNSLSTHDFQKWLLNCQRTDREMVVKKQWIKILGKNN